MVLGLPVMAFDDNIQKKMKVKFNGLNHNIGAGDGEIWDMSNLSSDNAPIISTRQPRYAKAFAENVFGVDIYAHQGLICISKSGGTATLFYNGIARGSVSDTKKSFAALGDRIVIFPDKLLFYATLGVYASTGSLSAAVPSPAAGDRYSVGAAAPYTVYEYDGTKWESIGLELRPLELTYTSAAGEIKLSDGTYFDEPAEGNTIITSGNAFDFSVGDAVKISGCASDKNNKTAVIREISDDKKTLRFYENVFTFTPTAYSSGTKEETSTAVTGRAFYVSSSAGTLNTTTGKYSVTTNTKIEVTEAGASLAVGKYYIARTDAASTKTSSIMYKITEATLEEGKLHLTLQTHLAHGYIVEAGAITLARLVPDLDFICTNENRVWGAKNDTVYSSKLGDPYNWNVFDGLDTDSYATPAGSAGDFTGCVAYLGYPIFFKEDKIYKIYGNKPSNFEVMGSSASGLMRGSDRSIAVASDVLFYLSRAGFMAYTGGLPQNISSPLGEERYKDAVAGSDGIKYYVEVVDSKKATTTKELLVFDPTAKMWHKESKVDSIGMALFGNNLYSISGSATTIIAANATIPDGYDKEAAVVSFVEFGDSVEGSPDKKGVSKIHLRLELDKDASIDIKLNFDSSDTWATVKAITTETKRSYYLPIIPRRTDHYRLRIDGIGGWKLYSLAREFYAGSAL